MLGKTVCRRCNEVVLNRNTKHVTLALDGLAHGGWQGGKEAVGQAGGFRETLAEAGKIATCVLWQ